jgi:two-component system, LytTR family, response regulator
VNTIRTLVIDDEKPGRARLLDLLAREHDIEIAGVGRDGREAVELIRRCDAALMFLDVQMPLLDGFGVISEIRPVNMPLTIFVTAHDTYAVRAFEANACDYLTKPFSDERFEAALKRARKSLELQTTEQMTRKLESLLQSAGGNAQPADRLDRILLRSAGRATVLDVNEIDWIEAAGVYVSLHVGPKVHLYRANLGYLEKLLDKEKFVRVHRSTIVNTERIRELQARSHGDYTLLLEDGTQITLSRGYRAQLENWLNQAL